MFRDNLGATLVELLQAQVVGVAETPDEALVWLALHEGHWNLAVLDLILKQGTGFDVLARMAPAHRRRSVVLTNAATPANIARCISLGADAVFDKSLQTDEFLDYCAQLSGAQMVS